MIGEDTKIETKEQLLELFREVKNRLSEDGGIEELKREFPIVEMTDPVLKRNNKGLTFARFDHWKASVAAVQDYGEHTVLVASVNEVSSVEINLTTSSEEDDTQQLLPLEALLPVLLHEFAHCMTPGYQVFGRDERGRRSRKWHCHTHSETFYDNFGRVLKVAEDLGIYTLSDSTVSSGGRGGICSKYSLKTLKKFDSIDLEAQLTTTSCIEPLPGVLGPSLLLSTRRSESEDPSGDDCQKDTKSPMRVSLGDLRTGIQKLVLLESKEVTFSRLLEEATKKFRRKRVSLFKDRSGSKSSLLREQELPNILLRSSTGDIDIWIK